MKPRMNDQFHAQAGEDILLAEIFAGQSTGVCLEVGVLDGLQDSTTLHFERRGWSCILVEANPGLAAQAKNNRRAQVFACAAGRVAGMAEFVIAKGAEYLSTMLPTEAHLARMLRDGATIERVPVAVRRVDEILAEAGIARLDFATIDVEGAELEVLQGFDLARWQLRVLVVEDNSGGQDRRVRQHLAAQGYRCFLHAGLNDWYAAAGDARLLTPARRAADFRRQLRARLYAVTVGLLPVNSQRRLVSWKRKYLGRL